MYLWAAFYCIDWRLGGWRISNIDLTMVGGTGCLETRGGIQFHLADRGSQADSKVWQIDILEKGQAAPPKWTHPAGGEAAWQAAAKGQVSQLSSFTRTIPGYKKVEEVNRILSQRDHFIPLAYKPGRAHPGDFIYLIYQGMIVGRARIISIDAIDPGDASESGQYPSWARWVVRYAGGWANPPREIPVQGHQSVRYLETNALDHLDSENWQSF